MGWPISDHVGFLLQPDPLMTVTPANSGLTVEVITHISDIAQQLPDLIDNGRLRTTLEALPVYDMQALQPDRRIVERVFQMYCYFASAYVHPPHEETARRIPAGVAVPLVALAQRLGRPPILAYAAYTLTNWQRRDPSQPITVDNLDLIQRFITLPDAAWFTLIHVEIEAEAGPAIAAIRPLLMAAQNDDMAGCIYALQTIHDSLINMTETLKRMPEGCHPDRYYREIRPYIFGFDDVIYDGVTQYEGKPVSFRGETGAQSTIIPVLIRALGLQHEQTELLHHLRVMHDYMPREHRIFLHSIDSSVVRHYVEGDVKATRRPSAIVDAYNETLKRLLDFRQLHLRFAAAYIANKVENPQGTGGTEFVQWLKQLIDETANQILL